MLVPTDKAANNVIVVCKKYYLDGVIKELNSTKTYVKVNNDSVNVVSRHLNYMVKNGIDVSHEQENRKKHETCHIIYNTQMVAVALGPWASHSEDRAEP